MVFERTFRDWSEWKGNKIGKHEKEGLEEIGFTMEIGGTRIGNSEDTSSTQGNRPNKYYKLDEQRKLENLQEYSKEIRGVYKSIKKLYC